ALGLDATARNLLPELPRIAIRGCQLELKTETGKLDCPVNVAVPGLPVEVSKLDFPKSADLLIHAEARGKVFPPDLSKELDASLDVGLKHFSTRIFEGGGHVLARFHGTSAELSSRRGLQADLSLALRIPQFEEAVRALDDGKFAIPAPARALRGQIAFQAQGRADLGEGRFPFVLRSRMSSANQALNTDTTGALHFVTDAEGNTRVKLELDASLSDVKIELPRMELAKPPALTPDSRLVSASQKAREKSVPKSGSGAFDYEVHVVTPPGHPVKLLANLAKAPVPVQLDLKVSSQAPPSGTVSVENFPLELFHRDAALDHFKVVLRQPTELSPIDGELTVKYVDYTIKVLVLNTVGKPTVKLTSDPPLPENQLVAALLFGRPLEELDPSQGASVGSTRAALADGAIGLASLYVLASTPIQSVGYDPQTGVFSAKVRLAEGTSLNIGADTTSLAEVGVRKRLGAHWAITTGLEHPTDPTSRTLSALLEWSMRY
ncbi:MAG: translocation/assembly module TamB domain-containing protein, partial [Bdellovibrionota bacterium]